MAPFNKHLKTQATPSTDWEIEDHLRQAALQESEERYRTLVETSPDAITLSDLEGKVIFCNRQAARLHGFDHPDEATGQNVFEFIAPEDRPRALENTQRTLELGQVRAITYSLLKRDGTCFPAELSASLVTDATGNPKAFIAVVRDLTMARQAEAELVKLSSAIKQSADNVFITDRYGVIEFVNPAFEKLTGYTGQEVIGRTPRLLKSGQHSQAFYEKLWETLLAGKAYRGDFINRKKNGDLYYEEKTITPIKDAAGEITHFVSTGKDITERVQAFSELEQRVAERTQETQELYARAEEQRRELDALYRADEYLYRHLRLDQVLNALVDVVIDILHADKASVQVWDERSQRLVVRAARNYSPEMIAVMSNYVPGDGISGTVFQTGEPIAVEDARCANPPANTIAEAEGIYSVLSVPLKLGDKIFGVFGMDYCRPRSFSEADKRLFKALAQRAARAIENAHLYEQAEQVAALQERQRLARELHDSVTQSLYSLMLMAGAGRRLADGGDLPGTKEQVLRIGETAQQALKEMRLMVYEMRPLGLHQVGLAEALRQRLDAVEKRAGIQTRLEVEGDVSLPAALEEELYRIAQEALNNSLKHATSTLTVVRLHADRDNTIIEVIDNGKGFSLAEEGNSAGMGLDSMRERAKNIGANLTIVSGIGQGTTVKVAAKRTLHHTKNQPEREVSYD